VAGTPCLERIYNMKTMNKLVCKLCYLCSNKMERLSSL